MSLPADRHLWDQPWFRDLLILLGVLITLLLVWEVRAILLPVALGMALAYLFNPWIAALQRRWQVPRWLSTGVLMIGLVVCLGALGLYVLPRMLHQAGKLGGALPRYMQGVSREADKFIADRSETPLLKWLHLTTQPARAPASQPLLAVATQPTTVLASQPSSAAALLSGSLGQVDARQVGSLLLQWLGIGATWVGSAVNVLMYLALALTLTAVCFFYFSWRFDGILAWFDQYIPDAHREEALAILQRMDRSVAAWFRGRLIQALVFGSILCLGWGTVGVPYWLLLGLVCGGLALVPYLAVIGLPAAILLVWLDALSQGAALSVWAIVFWPALVYLVAQGVDGWVVEPLVQGKATDLDPLSVMLAVLVGGALLGPLGMILAIPVTACLKILWGSLARPRLLVWARRKP